MNTQDKDGRTDLIWAAGRAHDKCITLLIEAGANVNVQDTFGFTALMAAAFKGHDECLEPSDKGRS